MASLNQRLRELRLSAAPPITQGEMARELGFDSRQGYHHYESESGFKGRYLPMEMARRIAGVLADRGVDPDEVVALAGFGRAESADVELSPGEQKALDVYRALSATQRALWLGIAQEMLGPKAPPGEAPVLHSPARKYRPEARHA